jgi:hypothetical protein
MHYLQRATGIALTLALLSCPAGAADEVGARGPLVQLLLGVLELDDQTGDWDEISDEEVDVDFSSLPSGSVEVEYTYGGEQVEWGINSGGSVAWKSDDTRFSGGFTGETGGVIRVDLDNSLLLVELHLGGFVRAQLRQGVSVYAAAGPMVMYGEHDVEDEEVEATPQPLDQGTVVLTNSDDNDINIGGYARAGIEFEIAKDQLVGLGVRYMYTKLDFEKTVGELDIKGPQYGLTFTARF